MQDVFGQSLQDAHLRGKEGRRQDRGRSWAALGSPGAMRHLQRCPELEEGTVSDCGPPPGSRHDLG